MIKGAMHIGLLGPDFSRIDRTLCRGPNIVVLAACFASTAALFVALRCYVRTSVRPVFGLDDGLAIASLVTIFSSPGIT